MTTAIRSQYLQVKHQHPDALVLFRLGDFYETFDHDAEVVARELNITLTSREEGKGHRIPMAGVPYHAAEKYIAGLISKGHRVVICEQVGSEPVKGLMPRRVVRVVTPGTVVETGLLEEKANNYLVAVHMEGNRAGLAYADITTGDFAATEIAGEDMLQRLRDELARLRPAECVVPDTGDQSDNGDDQLRSLLQSLAPSPFVTPFAEWRFDRDEAERTILRHFGVGSLSGFGCESLPLAVGAAGALLAYVADTQRESITHLSDLLTYSTQSFMALDPSTRRNLELTQTARDGSFRGALLWVLDQTRTAMGGRMLRRWLGQPLLDLAQIDDRLDGVDAFVQDGIARAALRQRLARLNDLSRLATRATQGIATPRDLAGLSASLRAVAGLHESLAETTADNQALFPYVAALDHCPDLHHLLTHALVDEPPANLEAGRVIRPGFSPDLDELYDSTAGSREWLANLETQERRRSGIKSLKTGYNKVFGYYIEVSAANAELVPVEYIRRQTLTTGERYITPELKEHENRVLHAQERIAELEQRIFRDVVAQVAGAAERVQRTAEAVAHLDVFAALAEVAVAHNYCRPRLNEGSHLRIVAGRHPVVELTLEEQAFVPNDVALDDEARIILLTGPNMAGKSTYLRQVALLVLMAQIGSFVPAQEAEIGLVDRIFTRVGAADDIASGQSTFMVEMVETANILRHATAHSLVILDEVGRGTSTYDGLSIAHAVVEYLHNHPRVRPKTLFATHYHELTELAKVFPHVRNYNVSVAEVGDQVVFLRRIEPGGADRSYGIHVARLAGLPNTVLNRAEEILKDLEANAHGQGAGSRKRVVTQVTFLPAADPLLQELAALDVSTITPIEALNRLYQLQKRATERSDTTDAAR